LRRRIEDEVDAVTQYASKSGCVFAFIPPRAPHMGGLWKAGVKSAKHLLLRAVGNARLTAEELQTVLVGVEAVLNSRPLGALSQDPSDGEALTPRHLLTGGLLIATPAPRTPDQQALKPSFLNVNINRLQRWRQLQAKVQGFWKHWNLEYLSTLQPRTKWHQDAPNVAVDTLVVLKEPNQTPSKWMRGRVTEVHPGQDQRVRVVTVKTAKGIYKRPITKIAVLPLN
ncbi:hypothetical protein KR074_001431, partial [Drosophila pseudoananassae]